jgi:hypothetical protein
LRRWVAAAAAILAACLAAAILGCFFYTRGVARRTRDHCAGYADRAAASITQQMQDTERVAHDLKGALESGRLTPDRAQAEVARALEKAPAILLRMGILFRPGTVGQGLLGPCAERVDRGVRACPHETHDDCSAQPWFQPEPWRQGWAEPEIVHEGGLRVVYGEPFRLPGASAPSGIIRLYVAMEGIQALVDRLELGHTGYGFLLSAKGVFLADPRDELVHERRTIRQEADESQDPGRRRLAAMVQRKEGGFAECVSGVTGQRTWVFLTRLPALDWSLGLVYIKDDLSLAPPWRHWMEALEVTLALSLTLCLIFLAFQGHDLAPANLWRIVAASSTAILAATGVMFWIVDTLPSATHRDEFKVVDLAGLERFQELNRTRRVGTGQAALTFVPTGVSLQTLEVAGPGLMKMTGQIWQRFPRGIPREQRGIVFPEATAGEAVLGDERVEGDSVIQYYPFRVTVRVDREAEARYPFDRTRIRLRIWPRRFLDPRLPVPDLDAYVLPTPKALPGVDPEIDLPGWDVEAAEFSYALETYNTNFGAKAFPGQRDTPELLYNVTLKRRFVSPFIVAFLPVLAVAVLLFTLVLTVSQLSDRVKATGYTYLNFLRTTIALFFSLVVAQFNIRARVVADGVIMLEWSYFIMYGAIIAVSVNALAFAVKDLALLRYDDNAVAKFAFWPALLGCLYLNAIMYLL